MPTSNTRIEHGLLGDLAVPVDAYYGVQTDAGAHYETDGFSKEILVGIEPPATSSSMASGMIRRR